MNLLGCLQFPQSLRCRFLPKKDTMWDYVGCYDSHFLNAKVVFANPGRHFSGFARTD
jgi:hypothetical protein